MSLFDRLRARARRASLRPGRTPFILIVAGLAPAAIFAFLTLLEPLPVRAVRDLVFDSFQRFSPRVFDPQIPVRVVAIDDESLARVGRWPWDRAVVADLLERLGTAGAAAIAFDVIFSEPQQEGDGDARLAEAIGGARVVLGFAGVERGAPARVKSGFATQGDDPRLFLPALEGALLPIESLRDPAAGLGAINLLPDRDLVAREIPTLFSVGGELAPSFAAEALRVAQEASSILVRASNASGELGYGSESGITALRVGHVVVPTTAAGGIRVHFSGSRAERHIAAWRVLSDAVDPAELEGAILLVGATATALPDFKATPLEAAVPGIDIHAETIESLLQGTLLSRPDYFRALEALVVVVAALAAAFAAARLPALPAALLTQALILVIIGASVAAFLWAGRLLDPVPASLATFVSAALGAVIVSRDTDREKRRIREAFGRYVSPAVVETLAASPDKLALGGEIKELTLLFSDIRGFTSRSETLPAEDVVRFLNEIHTPLTEHVLASGGTLDKFMGDGMMAFWNAPLDHPDHVRAALRSALAMQETIENLDAELKAQSQAAGEPHLPLAIGVGVHTGPACIGNIGSHKRFDYSAIGDSVNATARIEPLCKTYGVAVLVSADTAEAAPEFAYLLADVVQLRGRRQETRLFALHGDPSAVDEAFSRFKADHDRAVTLAIVGREEAAQELRRLADEPLGARYRKLYVVLLERLSEGRKSRRRPGALSASA